MTLLAAATAACSLLAGGALAATADDLPLHDVDAILANTRAFFRRWAVAHEKEYLDDAAEFNRRLTVFEQNCMFVKGHNAGGASTTLKLNQFADQTFDEFHETYLGYSPELRAEHNPARLSSFRHSGAAAPASVDWTEKGAVTPVKNQGQCGSCWAFSTTGSVEGVNYLETGDLVTLSEQELVDCDRSRDAGCGGGLMDNAFAYILKNGGLDSEKDYAYWGALPSFCNHRKQHDRHVVDITGFEDVPADDEGALAKAVGQQPVSVAICVNSALQFYSSGVFDGACCTGLNHGVLVVGYGEDDAAGGFWKVKNSWGEGWGERGYFRLKKDTGGPGQCGIAMDASYPVKSDHDDPKVPTICDAQLFSLWECPVGTKCQCDFNLLGLLCLVYSCPPA